MKRTLWNITLASVITLVAYVALNTFWRAILSTVKNESLKLFLIALMTTMAFGFFLLYVSKIRNAVGENEMLSDYKDNAYTSPIDDFKLVIKRESKTLLCIAVIVFACFVLNTFDNIVFHNKTISFLTFFFVPLFFFSSWIQAPFVGYAFSAVLDCVAYISFLLIYRKKKYNDWIKNKV